MNRQVKKLWAPRGALSIVRRLRHAWWANIGHTDQYRLIAQILCWTWGLLLGRVQTLQALWSSSFRKSWIVFLCICWNYLERTRWAVFKSIYVTYRLQKGAMCVSFGFATVLLLGKAECEEDPCSLCMHTTFGFQRGYDGLMFHRGSSDPTRVDHKMITSIGTERGDWRDWSV